MENDLLNRLKIISQGLGTMGQFASAAEVDKAIARIEALEQALKDAQGVLETRNKQIEELRDRLALLNETQSH